MGRLILAALLLAGCVSTRPMSWREELGGKALLPGVDCDFRDESNALPERLAACRAAATSEQAAIEAMIDRMGERRRAGEKQRGVKPATVDAVEVWWLR